MPSICIISLKSSYHKHHHIQSFLRVKHISLPISLLILKANQLSNPQFSFFLLIRFLRILKVDPASYHSSQQFLQPIANKIFRRIEQPIELRLMRLEIPNELIIFIVDDAPYIICSNRSCYLRGLILIHRIELEYLLKGCSRNNSIINLHLNPQILTSYSPCPMKRILLRYCETSVICLGTDIL